MLLLFLTFFVFALTKAENVVTLDSSNFEDVVANTNRVLVEFYAPWCGHCKALAPEYEKAATTLKEQGVDTILAKVDATEEKDLSSKYGVRGFPTLKYFTNGDLQNPTEYTGGRTEETIVSWISKRALPALSPITDNAALELFTAKDNVVLVGFFAEGSDGYKVLETVADEAREMVLCGILTDESLHGDKAGSLHLYLNEEGKQTELVFKDELTVKNVKSWINAERFPLIGEIGPENFKDYMDRGLPLVWVALNPDEDNANILAALRPAATVNKGKLSFVSVDANKFQQHVNNLGITSVPGLLVMDGNDKYQFTDQITEETVTFFFEKYNNGQLDKFLKSQEPPEQNNEDVFVLVGKTFSDVIGKDKDVFVEFYAPWCGHCKKLAPEYEKVGKAFHDVSDLVIAKIDATENDTPEEIRGYPTLVFYPKGELEGVKYQGERKAENIIQWLKTKASVDVSEIKTEL